MCVFSLLRNTGRLFAVRTSAGSLFQMFGTAIIGCIRDIPIIALPFYLPIYNHAAWLSVVLQLGTL